MGKNDFAGVVSRVKVSFFFFFFVSSLSGIGASVTHQEKSNTNNIFKWKPSLTMS